MAGLRKIKDKYYARIWNHGKESLIPLNTKQVAKAKRLLSIINERELLYKRGDIEFDEIKNINYTNIEVLTDQYIDYLRSREVSEKTIGIYKLALNDFKEVFQDCDIDTVNLVYFRDYIRARYNNPHTANIKIRTVNAFMNFLHKSKRIKSQPEKIEQFKTPDKSPKYFSNQ
ncbi:MAG: site-specific integrase [Fidelibacterota bacterium]